MNDKLTNYINSIFAPYDEIKSVTELKSDLLSDLQERYRELKEEGKDDLAAYKITIESIGDIEQTLQEITNLSRIPTSQVLTNFNASNLPDSDFQSVIAHKGNFNASSLRGSNFTNADLTGSTFKSSDVRDTIFDGANLTDCLLSTLDLTNASFKKSILVNTNFSMSNLINSKFIDVKMTNVKMTMTDLRNTVFENCVFNGVDFKYSDLSGLCFDGQTFIGVKFDKAALNNVSFKDSILKNVSFLSSYSFSRKFYRAIKTICFDGVTMDKLTYAALKGMDAELSKVIVV